MKTSLTKVEVVIPVHNRRETTLQALRSISKLNGSGLEIHVIIVDDGSTDGTSEAIMNFFPAVEVIPGDGSLHYAGGTNRGIDAALKHNPEFIVTCNDDSIFHEELLQRLIFTARTHPKSIVGAMLLLWDQPTVSFQTDFKWNTWKGGWQQPDGKSIFDFPQEAFEVEGLAGNCVLIPVQAVLECGMMAESKFPHGWGDIQYFVRMRKAGWRLLLEPRAFAWCEPNTNPPALHSLTFRRVLSVLFQDRRHPLNLQRQFVARWESAPTRLRAAGAFTVFLVQLGMKALTYAFRPHA
jgi:GT2 family glycosyltransferase